MPGHAVVRAGEAVVSSTLAFTAKVGAVRADPRVALLAGPAILGQLKTLRSLARQARGKRPVFERWAR